MTWPALSLALFCRTPLCGDSFAEWVQCVILRHSKPPVRPPGGTPARAGVLLSWRIPGCYRAACGRPTAGDRCADRIDEVLAVALPGEHDDVLAGSRRHRPAQSRRHRDLVEDAQCTHLKMDFAFTALGDRHGVEGLVVGADDGAMVEDRLNWEAVTESLDLVRELKTAGVCMCETLGAPCWACGLDTAEEVPVGLLRDSGLSARVYGRWACCSPSSTSRAHSTGLSS